MDGVEIAESLLYADMETLSINEPLNENSQSTNVDDSNNNSYFDRNETQRQMQHSNYANLNETDHNNLVGCNRDNKVLGQLMNMNDPNSEVQHSENSQIRNPGFSFRPITPNHNGNNLYYGVNNYVPHDTMETNNANASENSIFQGLLMPQTYPEVTNQLLYERNLTNAPKLNQSMNYNIPTAFGNQDKFGIYGRSKNILEDHITDNTFHFNDIPLEDNKADNKSNFSQPENINSEHFGFIPRSNGPVFSKYGSGSENKTSYNTESISIWSDSQTSNNSENYFQSGYPVITRIQDKKFFQALQSPVIVQNNFLDQHSTYTSNAAHIWNRKRSESTQNNIQSVDSNDEITDNKTPDTSETDTYLEYIIESHQLLVKEKNKLILEMNLMKDDKLKTSMNFNSMSLTNASKVDKELNLLFITLLEINALMSSIQSRCNIDLVEPFYQILQNSTEIIQTFQHDHKDDVQLFLDHEDEQNDQEQDLKVKKLKQLYIYMQEIRSFVWAVTNNAKKTDDNKNKQLLRNLKIWVEERNNWDIDEKLKENMNLSRSDSSLSIDANSISEVSSVKLENSSESTMKYGPSYYPTINPGHCITPANPFMPVPAPNQMQNPGVAAYANHPYKLFRSSTIPTGMPPATSLNSGNPTVFLGPNSNTIKTIIPPPHLPGPLGAASQPGHHPHPGQLYTTALPPNNNHGAMVHGNRNMIFTPSPGLIQAPTSFFFHPPNPNIPLNPPHPPMNYLFYKPNPSPNLQ